MTTGLDVLSVGMVTAVGLDAPSSCAAMRARLDGFQETRFVGDAGEAQIGAPIPLPRKWVGQWRLAHLAAAAIHEAFEHVPAARGSTALILCLGEENRRGRVVMRRHMNYGQQTSWLLGCLDAGRTFDLDVAGCRLAKPRG